MDTQVPILGPGNLRLLLVSGLGRRILQVEETVQASLRKVLIDSHVSAVAIGVLLYLALSAAFVAVWVPINSILYLLASGAAGEPPFSHLRLEDAARAIAHGGWGNLLLSLSVLFSSLVCILAAWALSRWAYGVGPLRILASYKDKLLRKTHA